MGQHKDHDLYPNHKPSHRGRRRVSGIGLVLGLIGIAFLCACCYVVFNFVSAKRAANELAEYLSVARSRGERTAPEEFDSANDVPADDNAATYYRRAAEALGSPPELEPLGEHFDYHGRLTDAEMQTLRKLLEQHQGVLRDVRRARECAKVDWGLRYSAMPADKPDLAHVSQAKELSAFLRWAAIFEHQSGNDEAAVETVRDLLHLSRACLEQGEIVAYLVSNGVAAVAADAVMDIGPTLSLSPGPAATRPTTQPVADVRRQVDALIAELLDEHDRSHRLSAIWQCERMRELELMRGARTKADLRAKAIFDRTALNMMRQCDDTLAACQLDQWPAAEARLPKSGESTRSSLEGKLAELQIPVFRRAAVLEFQIRADRRAAATALALRLYALDHAGKLPDDLAALRGQYLKDIPADPFARDARALTYRAGPAPLLYSLGEDSKDDDADESRAWSGSTYSHWSSRDGVWHLTRPIPNAPAERPE